jgi:hypothetical protein
MLPEAKQDIVLEAGRGECASFQIVVRADSGAKAITAKESESEHAPSRSESPGARLLFSREDWLNLDQASNSEGATGWWPDVLVPAVDEVVHERRNAFPFDVSAEHPGLIYVEACVPQHATPGKYPHQVEVTAQGLPTVKIPVTLEVLHYELPATSSLPTAFGFSGVSAARAHGFDPKNFEAVLALSQRYATLALEHRLSLFGMTWEPPPYRMQHGQAVLDFSEYDRELSPFLDGTALDDHARFTSTDLRGPPGHPSDAERIAYWRALAAHLRQKGWLDRTFLYLPDEPKPEQFGQVRHLAELAHRADPSLHVLLTASRQAGLFSVADLWAPNLNCLYHRPGPSPCPAVAEANDYESELKRGAHLWWYQSCTSHGCGPVSGSDEKPFLGWPSYMVDHPIALNRAMGVLAFSQHISGELYYDTVDAYDGDTFHSVWRFHGNGDGTLFYPGRADRIGGQIEVPLASLRLKAIRDGLQDYELLHLAESLGQGEAARQIAAKLAPHPWEIERDPKVWEQSRHQLVQLVEHAWLERAH